MPLLLPDSPLDPNPPDREVEIPADPTGASRETVRVTLRHLPKGKRDSLAYQASAPWAGLEAVRAKAEAHEPLTPDESDALFAAVAAVAAADLDAVRWGVAGHRAEDFVRRDGSRLEYEHEPRPFGREVYRVVAPAVLATYAAAGLVPVLARAVSDFQDGLVRTPAEIWAAAAKPEPAPEEAPVDPLPASPPETRAA